MRAGFALAFFLAAVPALAGDDKPTAADRAAAKNLLVAADPAAEPMVDENIALAKADDKPADAQGPPNPLLHLPPLMMNWIFSQDAGREVVYMATVRTMAILSHLAVVIGMIVIAMRTVCED